MAWIRLRDHRARVVNLELFAAVEAVPVDEDESGAWRVFAHPAPGSTVQRTPIFDGTRDECEAIVDEIARAVWALDLKRVGADLAPR